MKVSDNPPLSGIRIIELAGIGPGPFAGMMLADLGAEVICVERPGGNPWAVAGHGVMFRSRRFASLDLKTEQGAAAVRDLCKDADAVIETFRPGVAERLGVGPQDCMAVNSRLVYGRMTGWGQDGPMAKLPGHDINYIALTGALHAIGRKGEPPVPPLNLVGDFGGGGMLLAVGMLAGLMSARATGIGRVVDAAMIDGASALMAMFHGLHSEGSFSADRGTHLLDSGAFFYDVYETKDGQWISIGAIESQFWTELCDALELPEFVRNSQFDADRWDEFRKILGEKIASYNQAELDALFSGRNTCYAPVLDIASAPSHPHHKARNTFVEVNGVVQGAPAPRFDGLPPTTPTPRRSPGADTRSVLSEIGYSTDYIDTLIASGSAAD
ncbi:CaiB/BaiF CoA-transferase family protein [Rhodococcus erythropolis]|uniref:CaiB/BaiF CoA transferase family protein n=1 Tax=Rhodococcus erythropolis TaxID=1833 RepID=UPI002949FE14|nr:CaiB/BaiF CoA-transferase family protein [Rhodococcus erythropolis]MDV6211962.1 CaiB/BaiF CoA-transferase family protein [Rhodococcus erythropolis]